MHYKKQTSSYTCIQKKYQPNLTKQKGNSLVKHVPTLHTSISLNIKLNWIPLFLQPTIMLVNNIKTQTHTHSHFKSLISSNQNR